MDRQFLDNYYRLERENWWFQVRERIIRDTIKKNINTSPPLQLLNVGAATGKSSEMLQSFGTVRSLEYDQPSFEFCRDVLNLDIVQGSILELPYQDNAFDLVCAFDVVEHVEDHQLAIQELFRVCKPGGHIFITVPAFMSLWSNHDVVNHHYRRYMMKEMTGLFAIHPGRCIRKTYFNTILFIPIWMYRYAQKLLPKKDIQELRSDNEQFNNKWLNRIMYAIFSLERSWLRFFSFPFGVSLMVMWRKDTDHNS